MFIPDSYPDYFPIPDPGIKKHRIRDPDSQHWLGPIVFIYFYKIFTQLMVPITGSLMINDTVDTVGGTYVRICAKRSFLQIILLS
jgi:hypothetical protein